jgi:DNA-binding transcriptional MerR regulator
MSSVTDITERKSRRRRDQRKRDDRRRSSMTIDELARRTGMTARNIRAHQSRGLLPPPEVRGRTGYYAREHLDRLELIKELQADGFNLESIRKLIEGARGSTSDVLRFTKALRVPFEDEEPEILDGLELAKRFGGDPETGPDPDVLSRAVELGLLRHLGEDRFEVRSPRLLNAGSELQKLGMPPGTGLDVVEQIRRHADGVAEAFEGLFIEEVWKPFEKAGRPPERWPQVLEALERLRPLATEALVGVFQIAMTERVEARFGQELQRMMQEAAENEKESA